MSNNKIEINYKNSRIEFDVDKEEWVAFLGFDDGWLQEFKRHTSLQKLKDAIDRFNKKEFKPIPIMMFGDYDAHGAIRYAEIISFTSVPGECWIRNRDERREKLSNIGRGGRHKIYAGGHVFNEPIIGQILDMDKEIEDVEKELEQKKKKRIHLIDSLETFDIGGYVVEPDVE
jgi:hypothetical protein